MAVQPPPSPQLSRIEFRPGINREVSRYSNEGGWYSADMIRFRYGKPEKIGGWQNVNGVGDSDTFDGVARNLLNWNSLDGFAWTAIGTNTKLQLWRGGTYSDITPVRTSLSATDIFSTSAGSTQIIVSITNHGAETGAAVIFTSVTNSVGGITISGEYDLSVITANAFVISATMTATGTSISSGGPATGFFLINPGLRDSGAGNGWGTGVWGGSTPWGDPTTGGFDFALRTWSLDNWGEDLVANPRPGGAIYYWDVTSGTDVRAYQVTGSPTQANLILMSQEDRHLIAFGVPDIVTSVLNPLYIRWCSQENLNDWFPSATNTAGDKLLSGGNRIVAALRSRGQILIWTEDSLYGMQPIGPPAQFGFTNLGQSSGLIGPNAMVETAGRTFWMADQKFMVYDGAAPRPLKCDVLRYVFDNLDIQQLDKIVAASNSEFNEVIWFYQSNSLNATDIDSCVAYNFLEDTWWIGTLSRTAWADRGVYAQPIAAALDNKLYFQEVGSNADGAALSATLGSGEFDIGDGQELLFLDRIIPDLTNRDGSTLTGNLNFYVNYRQYPGAPLQTKGPYVVSAATTKIDLRVRARQMALVLESAGLNQSWRLGTLRFRIAPDGQR